jgi:HK97 family phage portal protein
MVTIKTALGQSDIKATWMKSAEPAGYAYRGQPTVLHAYVARCVMLRANAVASLTYLRDGGPSNIPARTMYLCEASLCTHGAFWIERASMRPLNPSAMRVESDPQRGITGHVWQSSGLSRRYSPEQVVYAHTWAPGSDVGPGLAPLQIAADSAGTALAAEQFTRAFFAQGALPPLIISPDEGALTDADAEAVRTTWQRMVAGAKNAWRALVLRRGLRVQPIDMPALDRLAMSDVDDIALRRIGAAFGVPVTMLTDAANYATAAEHRVSFWRDTVLPDAELIAGALGLTINYDDIEALAEDMGAQRKSVIDLYQAGLVSRDEARQMMGFEADNARMESARMESARMESALRELDQWRRKSESRKTALADFAARDLPRFWIDAIKARAALGLDPFSFARFIKARQTDPPLDAERELLSAQMLEILQASVDLDALKYDDEQFQREARLLFEPVLLAVAQDQATAAMLLSVAFSDVEQAYDFAARWAKDYSYELVRGINDTTRKQLQEIFTRSRAESWSREQIVDRIARIFGQVRAEMIAATELTRAYSQGNEIARQIIADAGVELVHVWRTANDERVCPICGPRDGREQGDGWDNRPPAHINCRCWTTLESPKRRGR